MNAAHARESAPAGQRTKYHRMAAVLRDRIRRRQPAVGQALPTIKELAVEFDVSFVTAFRAVRLLVEDGLVSTARKRSGTVVIRSEPRVAVNTTIAGLLRQPRPRNDVDNFGLDMIQGLREEIARQGYRLMYHGLDEANYERRLLDLAASGEACALLLDQKTPRAAIERLAAVGLPAALFNYVVPCPGLSTVIPDYGAMARTSVDFLLARGYRRLGFYKVAPSETEEGLVTGSYYPIVALREAFVAHARRRGLDGDRILLLREAETDLLARDPATYGLPRKRPANWAPLGLLANHDGLALDIIAAIGRTDLCLGRDVGVIGCLDLEGGRRSDTPPTTWRIDGRRVGAAAVRELLRRVKAPGRPPRCVRLKAEFVDRGTA